MYDVCFGDDIVFPKLAYRSTDFSHLLGYWCDRCDWYGTQFNLEVLMQKWKIIKGSEIDFLNCPDWVTIVFTDENTFEGFRGYVSKWEKGAALVYGEVGKGPDSQNPECYLDGYYDVGVPIAERVPVEEVMAIPRGWLVNGKFTEDDRYAQWATQHGYEVIAIQESVPVPSIVDVILDTSMKVPGRPIRQVYKKLAEEVGEVGDALLAIADGAIPDEMVEGEVADVIICAVDLLFVHIQKQAPYLTDTQVAHQVQNLLEDRVKAKTEKWQRIVTGGNYV